MRITTKEREIATTLGDFLESKGWGIWGDTEDVESFCPKCNDGRCSKYCSDCGTKIRHRSANSTLQVLVLAWRKGLKISKKP